MKLENQVAIVTGAGTGIGKAIARAFAQEGADVVAANRTEKTGEAIVTEIRAMGRKAMFVKTDVGKEADVIQPGN